MQESARHEQQAAAMAANMGADAGSVIFGEPPKKSPSSNTARLPAPGVSSSINSMPARATDLLEGFRRLFPSEAASQLVGQVQAQATNPNSEEGVDSVPSKHTDTQHTPSTRSLRSAAVDWALGQQASAYAAAGGFTRIDMDDVGDAQGDAARPSINARVQEQPTRYCSRLSQTAAFCVSSFTPAFLFPLCCR